jgi:hypothetical protein
MNQRDPQKETIQRILLRLELWFAPILIVVPIVVSFIFLWDWYVNGVSEGLSVYNGELLIALLILSGNLLFDIPFLRSIRTLRMKKESDRIK